MIKLSNAFLREAIQRNTGTMPAADKVHLVGIRSAHLVESVNITRVTPLPDQYDDLIVAFGRVLEVFPATVDPGAYYTTRPANSRGTAHLCDGGPYQYAVGKHRGKPGLVQVGEFKLWRDADRDGGQDPAEIGRWESGNGINIHRGGTTRSVGRYSAGCQVIPLAYWPGFWRVIEESGQRQFQYWLLDGSKLL